MTGQALIARVGRLILGDGAGESPTPAECQDILTVLQAMLGQWATQRLTIHVTERAIFSLVATQQTYTIGPNGDFNHARPLFIDRASYLDTTSAADPFEQEIQILDTQQWQRVAIKALPSPYPQGIYYDYAFTAGLGNISFWPEPSDSTVDAILYLPTAITGFADLTTDYTFAPGYEDAIVFNLAKRVAPEFGRPITPDLNMLAAESLANVKRANIRLVELTTDPAILPRNRGWNILTGTYR